MIQLRGLAGDGRSSGCVVRARANERGCARVLWRARLLRACVRACVRACICVKEDPVGCGEAAAESAARESPPPYSPPPSLLPASPTKRRKKNGKKLNWTNRGKQNHATAVAASVSRPAAVGRHLPRIAAGLHQLLTKSSYHYHYYYYYYYYYYCYYY